MGIERSGGSDTYCPHVAISGPDGLDDASQAVVHTWFPASGFHALVRKGMRVVRFIEGGAQMCPTDVDCNDIAHAENYTVGDASLPRREPARTAAI